MFRGRLDNHRHLHVPWSVETQLFTGMQSTFIWSQNGCEGLVVHDNSEWLAIQISVKPKR